MADWVSKCYIRNTTLLNIEPRYNDSIMWRNVIRNKEYANNYMTFGDNGSFVWKGRGEWLSIRNIRPRKR